MNESKEEVEVEFKKTPDDGTVIAFFPQTMHDGSCNPGNIMSYMHNGQHGEASIDFYHDCTNCFEEDYASLLHDLDDPEYADDGHDYLLELANGQKKIVDPTKYEGWADVVEFGSEHYPNTVIVSDDEDSAVGLVLSERDHIEIVKVTDPATKEVWEIGTDKTPKQWAKDRVWCYDDKYV